MRDTGETARQFGEHARLGRWRKRLAFANFAEMLVSARRRNQRPRRACSPELLPPHQLVRISQTVLAVALCVGAVGLTDRLNAKENPSPSAASDSNSAIDQLIPWLLDEQKELRGVAFSEVIFDTTGKRVLAVDRSSEIDARVIKQISAALDETVKRLNAADNPVQQAARINEVSSHVEDTLRDC